MDVREPHPLLVIFARALVPSVFVGMGLERVLVSLGLLHWGEPVSTSGLVFSVVELVAGVLLWTGRRVRMVATLLAIFIVVDAFASHPFWSAPSGSEYDQLLHFLKNLSTLGGLLLLAAVHPSSLSAPRPSLRQRENVRADHPVN